MKITRRNLTLGGMSLLTGTAIGQSAVAQEGSFLGIRHGSHRATSFRVVRRSRVVDRNGVSKTRLQKRSYLS